MSASGEVTARDRLYAHIGQDIEYAMLRYGGTTQHSDSPVDADGWRSAPLADLVDEVMTHLRAGLDPWLSKQAIEDGARAARDYLATREATNVA